MRTNVLGSIIISIFVSAQAVPAKADEVVRLICHFTIAVQHNDAEPVEILPGVVIVDQVNADQYTGTEMLPDGMYDLFQTDRVPANVHYFPEAQIPNGLEMSRDRAEFAAQLLADRTNRRHTAGWQIRRRGSFYEATPIEGGGDPKRNYIKYNAVLPGSARWRISEHFGLEDGLIEYLYCSHHLVPASAPGGIDL